MELFLQQGYGMKRLSLELIKRWRSGTVILSPRDLTKKQVEPYAKELQAVGGSAMVDPQFYLPRADHERLTSHSYWPADYDTALFDRSAIRKMLGILVEEYCANLGASGFVSPGLYSSTIDDLWIDHNSLVIEEANALRAGVPLFHTLCLSSDLLRSEEQIHKVLDALEGFDCSAYYVVPEPPRSAYLVGDPIWISNLLDLCAGIRLQGKKVIVGYCNHQDLPLALCDVTAIAAGTFLNVRRFGQAKFLAVEDGDISRRSIWYYCPQALSEYQTLYLDMAQKAGILYKLATDSSFDSDYGDVLFSGVQPTSTSFTEAQSFDHYLQCLSIQVRSVTRSSYEDTKNAVRMTFETASELTEYLRSYGVRGRGRDFSDVVDASLAALDQFDLLRGMVLRQFWSSRS